jgi:hypothetical protein
VMYYEADTDTEAVVALQGATQNGSAPAQLIMFGGHGTQQSVMLGSYGGEEGVIDFSDWGQLSGLSNCLADGGTIVFASCSVGRGLAQEANIVNMFGELFPNAAHVFGETAPSNIISISFGPDGRVNGVQYGCPTYDGAGITGFKFGDMDPAVLEVKLAQVYAEIR